MIDDYLQELFRPDTGGGMFNGGGNDSARLMDMLKGTPMGGRGPTDSPYPMAPDAGGGMDMSARSANPLMPKSTDLQTTARRRHIGCFRQGRLSVAGHILDANAQLPSYTRTLAH